MIKYVGMSCVLVACIGMGQYFSVAAIRRIRALEQVLLLLNAIQSELSYCRTPVRELMHRLSLREEFSRFCGNAAGCAAWRFRSHKLGAKLWENARS